jgi:quinol monooxygenase YgiN
VRVLVAGHAPIRHDHRSAVIEAASHMRRLTIEERGCISYRFSFALDDPDELILIEEWSDVEALSRHLSSPHFETFSNLLRPMLNGPPRFTRYDIANASPLLRRRD